MRVRLPWMRNFSEQRRPTELTVFDAVLVFTALTALVAFVAWFFLSADRRCPTPRPGVTRFRRPHPTCPANVRERRTVPSGSRASVNEFCDLDERVVIR